MSDQESKGLDVSVDAIVVGSEARGGQTFSLEQSQHELKAAREAHKQRVELQRLEDELREAEANRTFRRRMLGIAFGAGLLIVVGGIAVGFGMAVWADDQGTRDFGEQLILLLVGTVAGGWAGFFAGSKVG